MSSLATVLPSSFISRYPVVAVLVVTTGMSARGATRPATRTPTGPAANAVSRCGRDACQPVTSCAVSLPGTALAAVPDSRSSLPPRAGTY